ncbi:pH-response regulator protein palc [Niveomyces insectorum RCEF 264]|uniref:pH-response regulator protein palC n=1 Tax=Niveomyces insectorum RCEF 264 TaxID=1081102 RepID=A0A162K6G4_9HYPO|nr:pH-response regulator protein palc [Niveomyces insectorum RCEF 264]
MPFPFVLPTTSAFSFSTTFVCPSHPSLLRNASTYRGIVRDTLKRHKRLPPEAQAANLGLVVSSLRDYLPYLVTVVDGLAGKQNSPVLVIRIAAVEATSEASPNAGTAPVTPLAIEWRATLTESRIPGKERPRIRVPSLNYELAFALATLGHAYALQARAALQPLYVVASVVPLGIEQRRAAITSATRNLLDAAAVFAYAGGSPAESLVASSSLALLPPDITPPVLRALSALSIAEATLLAVLKDDPYPPAVAQNRNENDLEWMYKAPDIPKVRAHLFARLCLAAAGHAVQAAAQAKAVTTAGYAYRLSSTFIRYLEELQQTSRAKACRFLAIDSDLGGQTGTALAWLHGALQAMGAADIAGSVNGHGKATLGDAAFTDRSHLRANLLSLFRKERSEKNEDRRIKLGLDWGIDAGRLEEMRILWMLHAKWTKQNDAINTQHVPPTGPLLAQMPSGREIHVVKPLDPPALDRAVLDAMCLSPSPLDKLPYEAAEVAPARRRASSSDDNLSVDGDGAPAQTDGSTLIRGYNGTREEHGRRDLYY